jgi:hypothetical protein
MSQILLTDPTNTQAPSFFVAGAPGYTTSSSGGSTAFPFRVHTNTSGQVHMQASGAGATTVYEATDGWVLNRAQ